MMRRNQQTQRFVEGGPELLLRRQLRASRHGLTDLSDLAGVSPAAVACAWAGRKVGAQNYLLLCAVAGIDPLTGSASEPTSLAGFVIDWRALSASCFLTRAARRLSIRTAAILAGVSVATISRLECGHPLSVESILSICRFVGLPPAAFLRFTGNTHCNALQEAKISIGALCCEGFPAPDRYHREFEQ